LKKQFGKGSFGTVWLCEDFTDGKEYAIKETSISPKINKERIERKLNIFQNSKN
jgi:serine/threonine protein kinase